MAGLPFRNELGECSLRIVQNTMNLSLEAFSGHYAGLAHQGGVQPQVWVCPTSDLVEIFYLPIQFLTRQPSSSMPPDGISPTLVYLP